jgi:hypothetical protein
MTIKQGTVKGEMNSITLNKYILLGLDSAVSFCLNGMSSSQSNKHAKNQSIDEN